MYILYMQYNILLQLCTFQSQTKDLRLYSRLKNLIIIFEEHSISLLSPVLPSLPPSRTPILMNHAAAQAFSQFKLIFEYIHSVSAVQTSTTPSY